MVEGALAVAGGGGPGMLLPPASSASRTRPALQLRAACDPVARHAGSSQPRARPSGTSQHMRVSTFLCPLQEGNSRGPYTFWPWGLTSGCLL